MMFMTLSKRRQAVGLLAVAALAMGAAVQTGPARAAGGAGQKDAKDEIQLFKGSWEVARVFKDGAEIPEEFLKEIKLSFSGTTIVMSMQDMQKKATITIDSAKKPKEIDLKFEDGEETAHGIYEFAGDTVKIHASESKEQRPKDFKNQAPLIIVLKRPAADKDAKKDKKGGRELTAANSSLRALQENAGKHKLQGAWSITAGNQGGKELPPELVGTLKLTFEGDQATIAKVQKGVTVDKSKSGPFKVDDKAKPGQIDMTVDGKTALGIYQIDGDTLKLCLNEPGKLRPTAFKVDPGSTAVFMIFKREKSGKAPVFEPTSLVLALSVAQEKKAVKSDKEFIQGFWQVESAIDDGAPMPDEIRDMIKFNVVGDKVEIKIGDLSMKGTYTVDESKKPKTVDIKLEGGDGFTGIYEVVGDKVKFCLAVNDKDVQRPKEFKSEANSGHKLVVLKRVPQAKKADEVKKIEAESPRRRVAVTAFGGGQDQDALKPKEVKDLERIAGLWKLVKARGNGEDAPADYVGPVRLTFGGDGTIHVEGTPQSGKGTFMIDAAAQPKQITLTTVEKNATFVGIYKFEGNKLVLCLGDTSASSNRPQDFTAEKDTKQIVFVLELLKTAQQIAQEKLDAIEGAGRSRSANNLRSIGIAMHQYQDRMKHLPAHALYAKDGKTPLLSWRVAVLPYIGQAALYGEFKRDEPWDSAHNKMLIAKMPKFYEPVGLGSKGVGLTYYQVFTGADSVFDGAKTAMLPGSFRDGTSNTILVVEAKTPVIWSKPDDLVLPKKGEMMPELGGMFNTGMNLLFCDGAVLWVRKDIDSATLRAFVTPAGGEVVNIKSLQQPAMMKKDAK